MFITIDTNLLCLLLPTLGNNIIRANLVYIISSNMQIDKCQLHSKIWNRIHQTIYNSFQINVSFAHLTTFVTKESKHVVQLTNEKCVPYFVYIYYLLQIKDQTKTANANTVFIIR